MRIWLPVFAIATCLAMYPNTGAIGQDAGATAGTQTFDHYATKPQEAARQPQVVQNPTILAALQILEHTKPSRNDGDNANRDALHAYYAKYVSEPIWLTQNDGLNERATAVIRTFKTANDWGLSSKDFALSENIKNLISSASSTNTLTPQDAAKIEIAISSAALKYAHFARGGRIPDPTKQLSSYIDRTPQLIAPDTIIEAMRQRDAPDKYLQGLHPKHAQFEKLRQALLAMRDGKARPQKPEDVKLPTRGPMLRAGRTHADVALLRKRLSVPASKNTPETTTPQDNKQATPKNPEEVFDETLEAAVKAFQKDNGLYQDGLVGPSTRRTLNGAGAGALTEETIIANMEAWRWMPKDLSGIYVTVNIPEYAVRVVKDGEVIHSERAIVGKTNNQTPVFSDEMETVVIHPQWGVPNSIKVRELWPSLARGGAALQRQGLKIKRNGRVINPASVDWAYADIRNYDVYQPPGPRNALGIVKFLFPNKHQVYLHDTPKKSLFANPTRTYSHGCMRIRNPVKLAEIVLEHDKNLSIGEVHELFKSGPKQNRIALDSKIPVHVTYFTAVVDEDGTLRRLKDIYGHEKRIKLALAGRFNKIAVGRDHLRPVKYNRRIATQPQSFQEIFQAVFGGF